MNRPQLPYPADEYSSGLPSFLPAHGLAGAEFGRLGAPFGEEVPSLETSLSDGWRMLLKHRWTVLGCVLAALVVGIVFTLISTPIYRAIATVQVDREAAKVVDTHDASQPPTDDDELAFYATQLQLLKSRNLVERVVRATGLAQDPDFLARQSTSPMSRLFRIAKLDKTLGARPSPSSSADLETRAVGLVQKGLTTEVVRGSHVFKISFDGPDPATSARIANAFADQFIQSNLDRRFDASNYAREFLENKLEDVKEKLENSEKQLVQYAQNQQIINVDDGKPLSNSTLQTLTAALDNARGERIKAEMAWREASGPAGNAVPQVLASAAIQDLQTAQAKLQADYEKGLETYRPAYPPMLQMKAQIDEYDRRIRSEIDDVKTSLRSQYDADMQQEQALAAELNHAKSGALDLRARSIQYDTLQREVDTNRSLYDGLLQRYKEVGVAGGVGTNNISVIDRALVPAKPYLPNWFLNVGVAGLVGLIFGGVLALALELMDETLKIPEEIGRRIGVPLFGSTPQLAKGLMPKDAVVDQRSAFAESYYSIRTALQFSTSDGVPKSLLIASARSSEGKSTTAAVLAASFARLGARVLLIDADLRNPTLHNQFEVDAQPGLSNYLTGAARFDEILIPTDIASLFFVHSGELPPNPTDLLGGKRLSQLLSDAEREFDLVVVDGPPVLGLGDATLLASVTSGVLIVVEAGRTHVRLINASIARLRLGRARILGAVLTKFNPKRSGYGESYGYGYGYGYGDGYFDYPAGGARPRLPGTPS
jgi:capsular exopolysaccharide synthesis family protein